MMIKEASIADITKIMFMSSIAFPETYKSILSSNQIDYMMKMMYSEKTLRKEMIEDDIHYYIFYDSENESNPVGYISISKVKPSIYHLDKIYVLPDYQKQGIGRKLFDFAVEKIKSLSGTRMELNVNRYNPALRFYKHMGMIVLTEGDFPIGNGYFMNDYIMELDFPNI